METVRSVKKEKEREKKEKRKGVINRSIYWKTREKEGGRDRKR